MSACIDRSCLKQRNTIQQAFTILDTNKDGTIGLDDFEDLFNSYGGAKIDLTLWNQLLEEADNNGDGVVSFEEFE